MDSFIDVMFTDSFCELFSQWL